MAKQGGGDLARHFDLQPIWAKKGGGLSMNSTVTLILPIITKFNEII